MRRCLIVVVVLACSFAITRDPTVPAPPQNAPVPQDATPAEVARKAHQILKERCFHCHGLNGQAEANVFVLDRDRLLLDKVVVPGSATSKLIRVVESGLMPADLAEKNEKLPDAELAALKTWVAAGAPAFDDKKAVARKFLTDQALIADIDRDLRSADPRSRQFLRYFSIAHLYNGGVADDELEGYRIGLSKLLNSLSWQKEISVPRPINESKTLLRFDLRDYHWDAATWRRILAVYPYGYLPEGCRGIQELSGADLPHVRADWLVANASIPPLYHAILELPETLAPLEARLDVDVKRNLEQEHGVVRAGIRNSGVSRNNRVVERHNSAFGAYWKSYDFSSSQGEHDMFRNPLDLRPAGGEMVFHLPNGMQAYMIVDASNRRLDEAPVAIVSDRTQPDDPVVRNGVSCMGCHYAGMKTFTDDVRPVVQQSPGHFDHEKVLAIYPDQKRLDELLEKDARRFARAIEESGGKVSVDHRTEPINRLSRKFKSPLTLELAAAEAGHEVAAFKEKLNQSTALKSLGITGQLTGPNPGIKRDTWEENFGVIVSELRLGAFARPAASPATAIASSSSLLPEHEILKKFAGTWEGTSVYKFGDGTEHATQDNIAVTPFFDGLFAYQVVETRSTRGDEEYREVSGFDRHKKKFTSVQLTARTTRPTMMEGVWDEGKRTFTNQAPSFAFADGNVAAVRVDIAMTESTRNELGIVTSPEGKRIVDFRGVYRRRTAPLQMPSGTIRENVTLSDAHKLLKEYVGKWEGTATVHSNGSTRTGKATESSGTFAGGTWLQAHLTVEVEGSMFQVLQFVGYDPGAEKFRVLWVDSGGRFELGESTAFDDESGTIAGEAYDENGKRVKWTEAVTWVEGRRKVTWTLFDLAGNMKESIDLDLAKR